MLPVALAGAWTPVRAAQSNVVVALAMVAAVAGVGMTGRRAAVVMSALCAAAAFTFFDTAPYERFTISRRSDVITAVSLFVVGLVIGELAIRLAQQRRAGRSVTGDLRRVGEAASLLAAGEELVVMIGAVAEQLEHQLHLADCWYLAEPIAPGTWCVGRDGSLDRAPGIAGPAADGRREVVLPVWALGQVVGHFVLKVAPGSTPAGLTADRLRVAVTLADQVGGALAAQAPPPPLPPGPGVGGDPPGPTLRVLH